MGRTGVQRQLLTSFDFTDPLFMQRHSFTVTQKVTVTSGDNSTPIS